MPKLLTTIFGSVICGYTINLYFNYRNFVDLWKACNYKDVISVLGELIVAGFCIYSLKYSK